MSYFPICKDFGIKVDTKNKKYIFVGFFYKDEIIFRVWEDLAFMIVIFTDFSRKELEKIVTYNIGRLKISRVERNSRHYLRVQVGIRGEEVHLNQTEVKFFPAICNRIIARCDILMRTNEYEQIIDDYWIDTKEGRI